MQEIEGFSIETPIFPVLEVIPSREIRKVLSR
jgi:hypothetical protein